MKRIIVMILLLLLSAAAQTGKFDPNYSGGLDTTIDQVLMRGLWQDGDRYGSWRVVSRSLGWEHTRSYLYIQWLITDEVKQMQHEIKTMPITEFNDTDWRHLVRIGYQNSTFTITYVLRIDPGSEKRAYLKPGLPEKYEISFEK